MFFVLFCYWFSFVLFLNILRIFCLFFFFFKQKTAYEMPISDWISDVCSSDLRTWRGSLGWEPRHHTSPLSPQPKESAHMSFKPFEEVHGDQTLRLPIRGKEYVIHPPRADVGLALSMRLAAGVVIDARTEERRVGKGGGSRGRSRGAPYD